MTAARPIIPGSIYLITRRCLERRRFLAPDERVNALFSYLLAAVSQRHGVEVLAAVQMSNHYHAVIHDPEGNAPAFMREFHALVGRGVNRIRGRSDAFWSADQASLVELVDREAVLDRMAYVLCNPVAAGLVEHGRNWPATRTAAGACAAPPRVYRRPAGFLRKDSAFPDEAELVVGVPPTHGDVSATKFAELLASRVRAMETQLARDLRAQGLHFMTPRALLRLDWNDAPTTPSGLFSLNPLVAARDTEVRHAALARQATFVAEYTRALRAFRRGRRSTVFPGGSWMLPRHFGARVAKPPPPAWCA